MYAREFFIFLNLQQFNTMNLRHFTLRLNAEHLLPDQDAINTFMDSVTVKKSATQFVPGNPDFWSVLVYFDEPNGKHAKQVEKAIQLTEADLNEEEKQILLALKLWRKDKATEAQHPEFMILHNATLVSLAKEKPRSLETLAKIKGLGQQKVLAYGDDVMAILNAF